MCFPHFVLFSPLWYTLLLSHLQALWISDEKTKGCNFHYYLPFVKELFPLLGHSKQIESQIGLKTIRSLKDTSILVVQPFLGWVDVLPLFWSGKESSELDKMVECVHTSHSCVLPSHPFWNPKEQKSACISRSIKNSVAVKSSQT